MLNSQEVTDLKKNIVNSIRNKSAFHIDPEPVKFYLNEISNEDGDVSVWELDPTDNRGHSPLAINIIENYLVKASLYNPETARLTSRVYGALRDVVLTSLASTVKISMVDE